MKRIETRPLVGICGALLASLSLAALFAGRADSAPAPPFSSVATQSYSARGRGTMAVDGPGCCAATLSGLHINNVTGVASVAAMFPPSR